MRRDVRTSTPYIVLKKNYVQLSFLKQSPAEFQPTHKMSNGSNLVIQRKKPTTQTQAPRVDVTLDIQTSINR
jgi:hypothetical protein